jgi:hypothetical protein
MNITRPMNPPPDILHLGVTQIGKKVLHVRFENGFVPVTAFQMRSCFQRIAPLVSDHSDDLEEILMIHSMRKHSISSAYSLPDANVYIRNWPKDKEATIKVIYSKNVPGLDVLALLADIFMPERFVCMQVPH